MFVAFDKCMVKLISGPMFPFPDDPRLKPNSDCTGKILEGFYLCEEELKENVIGFIDVIKMMNESFDLK